MSKKLIERLKNEGDGVMSRREKTLLAGYIEELEKERDQLREHVKMLRIAMENAWQDGYCFCGAEGLSDAQKQFQRAVAATEPK